MRTLSRSMVLAMLLAVASCLSVSDPKPRNVAATLEVPNTTLLNEPGAKIQMTITAINSGSTDVTLHATSDCLLFYQIRNAQGILVYTSTSACSGAVVDETLAAESERSATLEWDGRSFAGSRVPQGTYILVPGVAVSTGAVLGTPAPILVE